MLSDVMFGTQADLQSAYQSTRAGFNQVVEFFGENVAALTNESDFWNE